MKLSNLLLMTVAGLLMSACQLTPPIAPVSLMPPLVCLTRCQVAPEPPRENEEIQRRMWEVDMISGYGRCRDLHDDCITSLKKRQENDQGS